MARSAILVAMLPGVASAQVTGIGPLAAIEHSVSVQNSDLIVLAQVHTPYPFPILPLPDRRPDPPEVLAEWVGPNDTVDIDQEQVASAEVPQRPASAAPQPTVDLPQERFEFARPTSLADAPMPELVTGERPLTEPPALSRGLNIAPAVAEADTETSNLPDLEIAAEDISLVPAPGESIVLLPNSQGYRILFSAGSGDLTTAGGSLLEGLALRMEADPTLWIQIRAYATDAAGRPSNSRSLSLNRALLIRSFLIDRGVRSTRVDIRALGNTAESEPRDRVDLIFSN